HGGKIFAILDVAKKDLNQAEDTSPLGSSPLPDPATTESTQRGRSTLSTFRVTSDRISDSTSVKGKENQMNGLIRVCLALAFCLIAVLLGLASFSVGLGLSDAPTAKAQVPASPGDGDLPGGRDTGPGSTCDQNDGEVAIHAKEAELR